MTTTDTRSPASRIADSRLNARQPLKDVLWILRDAQDIVQPHVHVAAVSALVGHEVAYDDINTALLAVASEDDTAIEVALNVLQPLIECAECNGVHDATDEVRECAYGQFSAEHFIAFHEGDRCASTGDSE